MSGYLHGTRFGSAGKVCAIMFVLALVFVACGDDDDGVAGAPASFLDATDVSELASDRFTGRDNDTAGSQLSQDYLIGVLRQFSVGLDGSASGDDAFKQHFPQGTNILSVIPGGDLADEYVMVGAHYDHISGAECDIVQANDSICNGATDNATGVAAVLAIGRAVDALPSPPRRSVVLALWDREEDGLLGSAYYVGNPLVSLADTVGYLNFDILGNNIAPSLRSFSFAIGAETGGAEFSGMLDRALAEEPLNVESLSFIFGQLRSDYVNLVNAGVPTVFFSDANGPCYHTNGDELEIVDFGKLEMQTRIGTDLAMQLIMADEAPPFTPLSNLPTATFADAQAIARAVNAGAADADRFQPADRDQLLQFQSDLNALIAAGEANFGNDDIGPLLTGTADIINVLRRVECDGFLE